jgi:iron complex transport system permease protein
MTASERAPLGAVLAVLLSLVTLTGAASVPLMAALMCLLALLVGIGWPDLLELPSALGSRIVVVGTGMIAALLSLRTAHTGEPLWSVVVACALGIFAAFVHQMLRPRRDELSASLTGTVGGVMLTGISATWVVAQASAVTTAQVGVLAAEGAGLAITLLVTALGMPRMPRLLLAIVASAVATSAMMHTMSGAAWPVGLLVGAVIAVGASGVHLLLGSVLTAREPLPSLAVAAAPVSTVGVVALLTLRLLG